MKQRLNTFDQYSHLENRLTYALAVTLERSAAFRQAFLRDFAPAVRLDKSPHIELQLAKGRAGVEDGIACIPDLAIIDGAGRAVIIESKVGAVLNMPQLAGHENRARRNKLSVQAALAITGRDGDGGRLRDWMKNRKSGLHWRHVTWRGIYRLSSRLSRADGWAKELREYMDIVSLKLDGQNMGSNVKMVDFTGIPFKSFEDFDPGRAKRTLRSLMDRLDEDKAFLKALGFKKGQTPRHRKKIGEAPRIWDYLSPVGQDDSHKASHHFTVAIEQDKIAAMLTVPNGRIFRNFRGYMKGDDDGAFDDLIGRFLKNLGRKGVLRAGGQPCISVVQRRYKSRQAVFAVDGEMSFDIRTMEGRPRVGTAPPIKAQPLWLKLCKSMILNRQGNVQFQIGVRFPYGQCPALRTPKAAELVKNSFISLMPVAEALEK